MDAASRPHRVDHPVMLHRWESLTFLHWRFEPEAVQRLLPPWPLQRAEVREADDVLLRAGAAV